MLNRFDGQVVLITGASSGIGAALAREFAREGAHTVLMARRAERIEELARGLTSGARRSLALAGDVTRDGDVEHAVDLARREFGRLDVAVANAGFSVSGLLTDLALEDYRRQMETNVFGVLRTLMATLPALRETRGRIVLTGSMFGMMSIPGATPYCMSKWALGGLAEGLSLELAAYGISVTHIMAGVIETEIHATYGEPERPYKIGASTPLGRPGTANEIAEAIVWLLSDASSYVTGAIIDVTGGR